MTRWRMLISHRGTVRSGIRFHLAPTRPQARTTKPITLGDQFAILLSICLRDPAFSKTSAPSLEACSHKQHPGPRLPYPYRISQTGQSSHHNMEGYRKTHAISYRSRAPQQLKLHTGDTAREPPRPGLCL